MGLQYPKGKFLSIVKVGEKGQIVIPKGARELFGIEDDIYGAIRWHTTGKPDMTLLEKIIYLADFVEPTRDFPGVEELRELCFEDIDAAMAKGLEMSLEFIRSGGAEPYKDSVEACEWYAALVD